MAAAACGMPIGYSSILLRQLIVTSSSTDNNSQSSGNWTVSDINATNPLEDYPNQTNNGTAVLSPETLLMDMEMGSWISGIHSAATPVGCLISGPFSQRFGQRMAILVSIVPFVLSWIVMATSHAHWMLLLARICGGMAVGFLGAPIQIYIAEISEPHLRGMLIGSPYFAYSLGILFVFMLGWSFHWRIVAWLSIILPCLTWLALLLAKESPVWLVRNRRPEEAFRSLCWLRDTDRMAREEVNELIEAFEREEEKRRGQTGGSNFWRTCTEIHVLKPLLMVLLFFTFQNLSGTLLIVFYAVQIIQEFTGDAKSGIDGLTAAVYSAAFRLLSTLVYCVLLRVVNRRTIVNWAGTLTTISAFLLALLVIYKHHLEAISVLYISGGLLVFYLLGSTGLFVMSGVTMGELLPASVRSSGSAYILLYNNVTLFVMVKLCPGVIQEISISGLFFIFAIGGMLATLIMFFMMPEAKDKKLTEIEEYFRGSNWLWIGRRTSD